MTSKDIDYSKELVDSLWQSARLSVYTIGFALIGKKALGIGGASTKMDAADAGKLVGYLTAAIVLDDYMVKNKYYSDKISKT